MKKFFIQSAALLIVIFAGLAFATGKFSGNFSLFTQRAKVADLNIHNTKIKVEIVDTKEKRTLGLGGRENLATDSGMLFIFDRAGTYSFWMKGLKFPLDFIWIRDKKVVDIIKNAKPPEQNQKDETLPLYVPNQPVEMVLEVNAGFVEAFGIQIGDGIEVK